ERTTARSALCPCGSGRRYKHCCGRVQDAAAAAMPQTVADLVRRAHELVQQGAAHEAAALLSHVAPPDIRDADVALDAGRSYLQMHLLQPAFALFERAIELDGTRQDALVACDECCQLMFRSSAWQSAGRTLRAQLDRLNLNPRTQRTAAQIHIVCKLDT